MLTTSPRTGADNWWLAIGWWQLVGGNVVGDNSACHANHSGTAAEPQRRQRDTRAYIRPSGEHQSAAPARQVSAAQTQITAALVGSNWLVEVCW